MFFIHCQYFWLVDQWGQRLGGIKELEISPKFLNQFLISSSLIP